MEPSRIHSVRLGKVLKPISRKESVETADTLLSVRQGSQMSIHTNKSLHLDHLEDLSIGEEGTPNFILLDLQKTKSLSEIYQRNSGGSSISRHRSYSDVLDTPELEDHDSKDNDLKKVSDLDVDLGLDEMHLRIIFDQLDTDKDHLLTCDDLVTGLSMVMGNPPGHIDIRDYFEGIISKYQNPGKPGKWSFHEFSKFMVEQAEHQ